MLYKRASPCKKNYTMSKIDMNYDGMRQQTNAVHKVNGNGTGLITTLQPTEL